MRRNLLGRLSALITAILLLLPLLSVVGFAEDTEVYDVESSSFAEDHSAIFPEIDLSAYTGSSEDYIEMLTIHEDRSGVYLYLFNPSGKRVTGGSFTYLTSYSATLSAVGDPSSDPRFVKFKTGGWAYRRQKVDGVENEHIRRYDIGDVTLRYADGSSARFSYEGYFQIEDQLDATGAVTSYKVGSHFDSRVELDFDYTYYRTDTSSSGTYYHNQVDSIYFNIPNRLREDYGKLVDVKVSYRKARTKPVLVVDDQTLYDAFYKGIGKAMDGSDTSVPGFYTDAHYNTNMTTCSYGDSYNVKLGTQSLTYFHSSNEISVLYSLFMAEDVSAGIRAEASSVDWETILAWFYAQTNPMQESYVMGANGPISKKFFSSVDSDVTVLNVASLNLSADTFRSNHSFFTNWATYGFAYACKGTSTDVDLDLTDKILEIGKISQISGNSDRLYYAACDENDLKDCFRKSQTDDSTMYLVRFNVSQYLEKPVTIEYNGHSYSDAGYFFEEDVYLNYHILELTFESDNETITHVPVVTEGKDFGGDGTVEKDPEDVRDQATTELKESFFDQIKKILALIFGIAVVILIAVFVVPILMPLLRTIGNAIGSFFRWLRDKLRGASTKWKQRKNKRK